jgi:hypothetical protein
LLTDLRAVKDSKRPPLAHKDVFSSSALQQLSQAQASAVAEEMPTDQSGGQPMVRQWLAILLGVLLLISVVVNIWQAIRSAE